jgi:hypothetical protein
MLCQLLQIDYKHIASGIMGLHLSEEDDTMSREASLHRSSSAGPEATTPIIGAAARTFKHVSVLLHSVVLHKTELLSVHTVLRDCFVCAHLPTVRHHATHILRAVNSRA